MLVTLRSTTRSTTKAAISASLLVFIAGSTSRTLIPACLAYRSTHSKAAAALHGGNPSTGKNAITSSSNRNASYASDRRPPGSGGAGWDSSVDNPFKMDRPLNVFGRPLTQCGTNPMTGFYRDGYCNTGPADGGSHTVAAVVSQKWLDFSASKGNDLRPILSEGCSWCLCVSRWKQSFDAYKRGELPKEGVPKVKLEATHQRALDVVSIDDLKRFALEDANGAMSAALDPAKGGPIR